MRRIETAGGEVSGPLSATSVSRPTPRRPFRGSWSTRFAGAARRNCRSTRAKGYSATLTLSAASVAPTVSLTDDGHKIVSRLGDRLRIAGNGGVQRFQHRAQPSALWALIRRATQVFPELQPLASRPIGGLRPATLSMCPASVAAGWQAVDQCRSWHLGWTMACGSAAALPDLIGERRPEPGFAL